MLKTASVILLILSVSCSPYQEQSTVVRASGTFDLANRKAMKLMAEMSVKIKFVCGIDKTGLMGAGVVVGKGKSNSIVATANHVSKFINDNDCDIVVEDWMGRTGYADILANSAATDVAILEVHEPIGRVSKLYKDPYLGQSITCVGWPMLPHKDYKGQSITRGSVSTKGVNGYLRVSADLYFGNSGGGCFSDDGKVVGIVSHFMIGGRMFGVDVQHPGQYYISDVENVEKLLSEI